MNHVFDHHNEGEILGLTTPGPIVRVAISDSHRQFRVCPDALFTGIDQANEDVRHRHAFDIPEASINMPNHDLHKLRRSSLPNTFSKRKTAASEP